MAFTYHHLAEADLRAAMAERRCAENDQLMVSGRRPQC
jgi:hypothetical protein